MNKQDLIELLEDLPDDIEIRLAFQPNWPLEYALSGDLALGLSDSELGDHYSDLETESGESLGKVACRLCGEVLEADDSAEQLLHLAHCHDGTVGLAAYLATGNQLGYLQTGVADLLEWS
jgi:hypothetical protein